MMKQQTSLSVGLIAALTVVGCAHIAATKATFTRTDETLVLQIDRHMEEITHGPDFEEDQTLVLKLRDYRIGERLMVPSDKAAARLEVQRFGLASHGEDFTGWVIVRQVTKIKVVADLQLLVTARTANGSYVQKMKFKNQYEFFRAPVAD